MINRAKGPIDFLFFCVRIDFLSSLYIVHSHTYTDNQMIFELMKAELLQPNVIQSWWWSYSLGDVIQSWCCSTWFLSVPFRSVSFSVYTSFVRFYEMEETISCTQARNIRLNDFTPSFKLWIFLDYLHCLVVRCTIILFIVQWKRIFSSTSSAVTLWIVFFVCHKCSFLEIWLWKEWKLIKKNFSWKGVRDFNLK